MYPILNRISFAGSIGGKCNVNLESIIMGFDFMLFSSSNQHVYLRDVIIFFISLIKQSNSGFSSSSQMPCLSF
ncbi:hypothetical protein L1987_36765 [Smallanthus sonchifolius]|uniref:Uncharacterized protein n=1 Tax=Smallanthus sonchifolius TaxID=185202 RepID=A0ACB9HE19_9ASTR|nr:hypothetical protein L1987_36765 [Smallanthus sonchifolius]